MNRLVPVLFGFIGWLLLSSLVNAAEAPRPNVLLILCDDLGFSDLGCYGGEIRTPHLDHLASQGLRFTQFYNCAVCVTTRAALTTGLYPRKAAGTLREDMVTLGEVMQAAGYATGYTGKWHLGSKAPRRPIDRGFEEFYGLLSGCCNFFNPGQPDPKFYNGGHLRPFAHNQTTLTEFPPGYYTTDAFTDHAIKTIRRFSQSGKPFFHYLCYTAPHFPLHAPPEDIARYKGRYSQGYDQLRTDRHRRQVEMGLLDADWKLSPVDKKTGDFRYDYDVTPWEKVADRPREERRMEVYAAMVDRMDQNIGRLLKALDDMQLADNTLVLFLSDNGGCATLPGDLQGYAALNRDIPVGDGRGYEFVGPGWGWAQNTPFRRHKTWTYEGGIATPLIVRWPAQIKAGSLTDQPGHLIDIMPTLLELAGAKYPQQFQGNAILPAEGKSLLPILQGKQREPHDSLCWALTGNRAIRQGDWKLCWGASDKRWELYNLAEDRTETNDLAAKFPDRVARMAAAWENWARQCEVAF
ncbi:arylsulfatase [Lignipirellula cremea]|uniref:Arylsulfatase n=1 Tax=Lignipirellula cremea TaxID=2528010 RepID=A0A518E2E0_9BACT|nr:arylsulfatase [Lignipirellula cremea]QDU98234.1 Arylsulfatase [Lignipirellula cremea]